MSPSSDMLDPNTIHFNKVESLSLGFKELLFLAFILVIGFCGFTVCVEKIYESDAPTIESIVVHDKLVSDRNSYTDKNLTQAIR